MTGPDQSANFYIQLADDRDLSNATLTFRAFVFAGGDEGGLLPYVTNDESNTVEPWASAGWTWTNLSDLDGWQPITLDISDQSLWSSGFDSTIVSRIGLQLSSGGGSGPWANPTVVYIDSITLTGGPATPGPWAFPSQANALVLDSYTMPEAPTGTAVTWLGP